MRGWGIGLVVAIELLGCGAVLGLPVSQTHRVPMRDGTPLATDVYLPDGPGPFPTILLRTTYNKDASAAGVKLAQGLGKPYVDAGYAFVVQDTRGRFGSAGVDSIFLTDGVGPSRDGYDTIDWIARQRWSNGKVGLFGFSALGITSYMAVTSGHPALKCAFVAAAGCDLYDDIFYPGGVYRKSVSDGWVAGQGRREFLPYIHSHANDDSIWRRVDLPARGGNAHAAIYQWGGWYDVMSRGQIRAFQALDERGGEGARGEQILVMGVWSHAGTGRKQGELEYPANSGAVNPVAEAKAFFDHYLKGAETRITSVPPVRYYLMGAAGDTTGAGNRWMDARRWPPAGVRDEAWYLGPDRTLSRERPVASGEMSYVYDPKNPVPTLGGLNLFPPIGPADLAPVEARPDVLSFTSAPLTEPVAIAGNVRVRLTASSDAPDTDFMAMLSDVYPDGRSMLVIDGAIRARHRVSNAREDFLEPGTTYEFDIDLWDTAVAFERGHRIRVDITSSNDPRFDPNPNTRTPFRADTVGARATNTIRLGGERGSSLILPVLPLAESR